ncbi:hypothetical protein DNU06_12145 [Putridiphycobacter roseus]|uniref:Uncharacterized protein n=1 Tax=Putridiphycobacter roseus TaxID=2219161 RepID=A0A2W1NPP6_9FLAO|nr:hypothetical protein [Putridiphycobacter roseus]PZE16598.1 hypothetical protein DNU06_12145 [Putridiphycobacter roseus]
MKKVNLILAIGLMLGSTNVYAQTMKEKMQAKLDKANAKMAAAAKGKAKYTTYDYTDATGVSGTYFTSVVLVGNNRTMGLEYNREEGGEIVNKLVVHGGQLDGKEITEKYFLKEKYKSKLDINYFSSGTGTLVQIADNVFASTSSGAVVTVLSKDSADFNDYDLETAQVLYDQQMAKINGAEAEKETAIWMKNALYANNVGKIVFATEDWHLMKRGHGATPPMVNGKGFTSELDMAGNMNYMAFFKVPPSVQFPGQDINMVYEMGGKTTDRVEYRAKSAAWSKMISRWETSDFKWRQHSPKALRTYNQYHSQYVQDYAFMQCLYMNKNSFKVGQKYNLTVKMYANRDGENGELIAEGVVSLLYSENADLMFNGNPDKPEKIAVWSQFEEFLDE